MYIHAEHDTIVTVNISKVSGKDEPDAAVIAGDREGDRSASADGEECVQVVYVMVHCRQMIVCARTISHCIYTSGLASLRLFCS